MTDSQIILLVGVIIPLLGSLLIEWAVDKLEKKEKLPGGSREVSSIGGRKTKRGVCLFGDNCFECVLSECRVSGADALFVNRLPGDIDQQKQKNRCKKNALCGTAIPTESAVC